jgi:PAS domain S-box-containing protein
MTRRSKPPDQAAPPRPTRAGITAAELFASGGELGALMAGIDWAGTALGPVEQWPRALTTTVRIVLTSRQPMFVWWGDRLINLYNDAYCSILGGKHPWALGQPASLVWREIWEDIEPRAASALSRNEGTYDESLLLIMERYGYREETYYTFSYSPVPNDEGGTGGIFCANTDDTERIVGERQLDLLRELAARTADARTAADACGRAAEALATSRRDLPFALVYLAEPGAQTLRLAGAAGLEAGSPVAPLTVALTEPAPWPFAEALAGGQLVEVAGDRLPGGLPTGAWSEPPTRVVLLPIAGSGDTGRTAVLVAGLNPFRLLDERYRGFLSLVAGQLGAAIANAVAYEEERRRAEALAELDRAKTVFFSNVSHEFRTPLTLMLGPLQDLVETGDVPEEVRDRAVVARRNALRMQKLVNSLLDFSRIEAGRVEARFQPVDLARLTADLASTFRSAVERAGLRLVVDCPPLADQAFVDHDMWEKVVLNLVSNAFKFTLEGEIRVSLRPREGELVLRVSDTGSGIPDADLPHVFERFRRVQNARARTVEGTGIGLALVAELVKLHGGRVGIESEVNRGTTFEVTIPAGRGHLPAAQIVAAGAGATAVGAGAASFVEEAERWLPDSEPADDVITGEHLFGDGTAGASTASGPRARILVADDNADMRDYVHRLLGVRWEVETVGDGRAALERALTDPPGLLLSDVMMPGLDGFGLLQALRTDPRTSQLPIILLSARAGEEARVEGLQAGADDYLVKPFSARELLARVGGALELARVRREAAAALLVREQQFESLVDNTPLGVFLVDHEFRIRIVNPAAREVFGDIPELVGRDFGEVMRVLWPEGYAGELVSRFRHTLETGEPYRVPERAEQRLDRGVTEYYEWQSNRIPLPDGRYGVVCYFRDISAEVLARAAVAASEDRLRQAAKMEAVGRLAGGLAHDFNNQLHALRGFVSYAARDPGIGPRSRDDLQEVQKAVDRMANLTRQLLAFSRQQVLRPEVLDLDQSVTENEELLRRLIGSQIELRFAPGPGRKWVRVDRAQLQQVLLNLCINARDAMPEGGTLDVQTSLVRGGPSEAAGEFARVVVSDTGSGIAAEDLPRIFEPFFTTKEVGQGTGLGLATVHGIVAQSGGHIWAESERGQGTRFTVLLPVSTPPEERRSGERKVRSPSRSPARILIVEDEDAVRAITARTLRDEGYDVVEARHGREALARLSESGPPISLVLTDVVMPVMGGRALAEHLAREWPDLPLVWMSGYPRDTAIADGAGAPDRPFLQKPIPPELLAQTIAEALGRLDSRV